MISLRSRAAALAASLLLASLAPGQATVGGQDEKPARPAPSQSAERIDVENDLVLKTIRAAVAPTDDQMAKITELYAAFRLEQARVMRSVVRQGRDPRERRLGDGADPTPEELARRRAEIKRRVAEASKALSDEFLAACRAVLDETRHEAWDACAAELDLMRRGAGASQRPEVKWLDPRRGPKVGDIAPDFELADLEGKKRSLKSLRGKPVVIVFGSYTSPNFRQRSEPLRKLSETYGDAVHWLIVYTLEAHASDGTWISSRNTAEGIEIPQHKSMEDRLECAKLAKKKLQLSWPVLPDDMENRTAQSYSGHPNRGYVIDADGKIVSKQVWIDVEATKKALDGLLGKEADGEEGQGLRPPAGGDGA